MDATLTLQYQHKGSPSTNKMTTTLVNSKKRINTWHLLPDYVRMNPYDTYLDENSNIGMNVASWHSSSPYRNPMCTTPR